MFGFGVKKELEKAQQELINREKELQNIKKSLLVTQDKFCQLLEAQNASEVLKRKLENAPLRSGVLLAETIQQVVTVHTENVVSEKQKRAKRRQEIKNKETKTDGKNKTTKLPPAKKNKR